MLNIIAIVNPGTATEMMKKIKADKFLFITSKKINQYPPGYKNGKNVFCFGHRSLKRGRYYSRLRWQKVLPLDIDIVEKMFVYESETMKMVERIPPIRINYDTRKKYYMDSLRFFAHLIKAHNINCFYRCAPPHEGYDHVLYGLCKTLDIPIWLFGPFHPGLAYFSRDIKEPFPTFELEFEINKGKFDDYLKNKKNDYPKLIPQLKELLDLHWKKERPKLMPTIVPAKKRKTQKTLLARNKSILTWYRLNCVKPDYNKEYIYVPLHFQFEATTCPLGGVFNDQVLMIELLSRLGIQVYVKEHARVSKNRNLAYYKKIYDLKNVSLISQKEDNYKLIDNCLAVANVTGTAGWEAILRGKCTLLFGNIFHQYAPGCFHVKTMNSIKEAIEKIRKFKPDKRLLEVFLFTLQKHLFKHNIASIVANFKSRLENERNGIHELGIGGIEQLVGNKFESVIQLKEIYEPNYSQMISSFNGKEFKDTNTEKEELI